MHDYQWPAWGHHQGLHLALFRWGGELRHWSAFLISLGYSKLHAGASLCMSGFTFDCTNQIFKPSKPSANIIPFCDLDLQQCTCLTSASYSSYIFYDFCSMRHYQKLEMGVCCLALLWLILRVCIAHKSLGPKHLFSCFCANLGPCKIALKVKVTVKIRGQHALSVGYNELQLCSNFSF